MCYYHSFLRTIQPFCQCIWPAVSPRSKIQQVDTRGQCEDMATSQQNGWRRKSEKEEQHQLLPVSESRSSVRSGLAVKESFRFMEDLVFPSFPSNSLRSSFSVLLNGDNLSLLCGDRKPTKLVCNKYNKNTYFWQRSKTRALEQQNKVC